MAGTRMLDTVCHRVDRLRRPLGIRTARRTTILRARKAARAVTYAMQDDSSPVATSAGVSVAKYSAPSAPVVCPFLRWFIGDFTRTFQFFESSLSVNCYDGRFATQDDAPDNAQLLSVAIQLYPSSPGSRWQIPCFDVADIDSECSRAAMCSSPVSDVASCNIHNIYLQTIFGDIITREATKTTSVT